VLAELARWLFSSDAVRTRREFAGLSQSGLAAKAGTSQAAISYWESGTGNPQIDLFLALVRALDCEITDLLVDLDADNEAPGGTPSPDDLHVWSEQT
jgi:transcriptional regulator with XRE-family HTH domain